MRVVCSVWILQTCDLIYGHLHGGSTHGVALTEARYSLAIKCLFVTDWNILE